MDKIDHFFANVACATEVGHPTIACLFTGENLPSHCGPMPRDPTPEIGTALGDDLAAVLLKALDLNLAIHDGAILFGRRNISELYRIIGWSYRLFPDMPIAEAVSNKGSAFNSCFAMSFAPDVDRLYLISAKEAFKFERGNISVLSRTTPARRPALPISATTAC